MKRFPLLQKFGAAFLLPLLFTACPTEASNNTENTVGGGNQSSSGNTSTTSKILTVDTSLLVKEIDNIATVPFSNKVYLNLTDKKYSTDNSAFTAIPTDTAATITDGITILAKNISSGESSETYITIDTTKATDGTNFIITGTLKGELEFAPKKNGEDICITLSDATLTSGNYPCIQVSKAARTFLCLTGTNTLTDGRSYGTGYSEEEGTDYYTSSYKGTIAEDAELTKTWAQGSGKKGTFYTKGALLVSGEGKLTVTTGYKHGIYSDDYIRVFGGELAVENSGRSCIRSLNGFLMDAGTLTLHGTGTHKTHPNDDSRGIIVEGDENSDNAGKGYIYIKGGNITIQTTGKAISAKWDIDDDALTDSTDDDPNPVVMITGGTIDITTTDSVVDSERSSSITYTDVNGVSVTETEKCSPEGIEGKTGVIITGGTLTINTTDDALNASLDTNGYVNISGGSLYLCASSADAIDSNGDINISGGTIVAIATMGSEDGFDCDGALTFTGGIACGISGSSHYYASASNTENTQNTFVIGKSYTGSAGSSMAITESDGTVAFAFDIPSTVSSYSLITLSSPNLASGKTYTVYSGASLSGGTSFKGLYTALPSVSGGSSTGNITTKSGTYVYTLGVSENTGMGGGPGGTPPSRP